MQRALGFNKSKILAAAAVLGLSAAFCAGLGFVIDHEGCYFEVVEGDNGGATACGVTGGDYDRYRNQKHLPKQSVECITPSEVAECYDLHYWLELGCDNWQQPVALVMFDAAVNCGTTQAVKFLQRALGVLVDGNLGADTLAAEHNYVVAHGALALATAIIAQRRAFYVRLATAQEHDQQFLRGWLARCDDLLALVSA